MGGFLRFDSGETVPSKLEWAKGWKLGKASQLDRF
jgi:hypothetical protein